MTIQPEDSALVESMVGHVIVAAEWFDSNPGDDWTEHEVAVLTLDDGRRVEFGGWGHDASGATVGLLAPVDLMDTWDEDWLDDLGRTAYLISAGKYARVVAFKMNLAHVHPTERGTWMGSGFVQYPSMEAAAYSFIRSYRDRQPDPAV